MKTANTPPSLAEGYWAAKADLMQLIAFPLEEDRPLTAQAEEIYGLYHVDIERLLQVSPPVRGREMPQYPQAKNATSRPQAKGSSFEDLQQKSSDDWDKTGGSNKGSGRKARWSSSSPA